MAAKKRTDASPRSASKTKTPKPAAPDMRDDIRDFTLQMIQERKLKLDDLSQIGDAVLGRATASVRNALPKSRTNALRQVIDGFADAWAETAKSSAAAVRHAQENGVRAAKRDASELAKNLRSLEGEFVGTLEKYAGRLRGEVGQEFKALVERARKTGTAIRPAVQSAGKAAIQHPLETVGGLASMGMKVGTDAVSGALLGVSGLLEGLGKSLGGATAKTSAAKTPAKKKARSGG